MSTTEGECSNDVIKYCMCIIYQWVINHHLRNQNLSLSLPKFYVKTVVFDIRETI